MQENLRTAQKPLLPDICAMGFWEIFAQTKDLVSEEKQIWLQLKAPSHCYFRDCFNSRKGVRVTSNTGKISV